MRVTRWHKSEQVKEVLERVFRQRQFEQENNGVDENNDQCGDRKHARWLDVVDSRGRQVTVNRHRIRSVSMGRKCTTIWLPAMLLCVGQVGNLRPIVNLDCQSARLESAPEQRRLATGAQD